MKFLHLFLILFALFGPSIAHAREDDEVPPTEPYDPEADPVVLEYRHQTAEFEQTLYGMQTDDGFAGYKTELLFRGVLYTVDRTAEAMKTPAAPTRSPPRPTTPTLRDLIGDLSVRAQGNFRVKVTQEVYVNGQLESRDVWEIDMGGAYQASTGGFDEAKGKAHR